MLEFNNIRFRYDNAQDDTLRGVSFQLASKKVLAVVGPSGGGKSTLLRVLSGLERPYEGTIYVNQKCLVDDKHFEVPEKRGIGMLFQDYALFPHMTVQKNIEYGISHLKRKDRMERVKEVMKIVDMEGYERRYPHELSGGQQQRIALARALAPQPGLLLLDEPFSNLDAHLLKKVRKELFEIIRSVGITTVMVTHNMEDAETEADHIINITDGQIKHVNQ